MTTLRSLLADDPSLHLIASDDALRDDFDVPIVWVHNSDLPDPTPWLEAGQVLLTNGVQFRHDDSPAFADAYARRLKDHGILALGFATDVFQRTIPDRLVAACAAVGLVLFSIAEQTPFIGIIREVADARAAETRTQLEWSLQAQRAVARAALHPDGMRAIMAELARQLNSPVLLYDSVGNRVDLGGIPAISPKMAGLIDDAAREVLGKGGQAGLTIVEVGDGAVLQTLGRRGRLLGVLAVGTSSPLGSAQNDVVASVIALASIALEQRRTLDGALGRLRSGLVELLLAGVVDVADQTARRLWGSLPVEPLRLTTVVGPVHGQSLIDELEAAAERRGGAIFFAERNDRIVIISSDADLAEVHGILQRHGHTAGTSGVIRWSELRTGLTEADRASRATGRRTPIVLFEDMTDQGLLGMLTTSGGGPLARRILEPLLLLPPHERDTAIQTLTAWFEANCTWETAARQLGIHRHTLRNRIAAIEKLLHIDLDTFSARAETWAALQLVDSAPIVPAAPVD